MRLFYRSSRRWMLAVSSACLLWPVGMSCFAATAPESRFADANRLYEQGKFQEAAKAYEALTSGSEATAAVHFNLGNCWLKLQRTGLAIAAYHKALEITPRDPDILANLQLARTHVEKPPAEVPFWSRMVSVMPASRWAFASIVGVWIYVVALTVRRLRRPASGVPEDAGWVLPGGIACAAIVAAAGIALYDSSHRRTAVVVTRETPARYGPLEESKELAKLTDGMEVRVLSTQGEWMNVEGPAMPRSGWVNRKHLIVF